MKIPFHIAIIMDGNGRWAKERGLPRSFGHRRGINRIRDIIRYAKKYGVKILTFFAFSTENWLRPKKEVSFLFSHMEIFLKKYQREIIRQGVQVNFIGRRDRLNKNILRIMEKIESCTSENKSLIVNIALDYGGRWDILQAAEKMSKTYRKRKLSEEEEEEIFKKYLALSNYPDPDLLIRTSGERRISNFLLWHLAYTELYFPKVYWPDFDEVQFVKAIKEFSLRKRRYGKIA